MSEMNRRDAFKALAAVAGAAGLSVTPVTTQEAQAVELLKPQNPLSKGCLATLYFEMVHSGKYTDDCIRRAFEVWQNADDIHGLRGV